MKFEKTDLLKEKEKLEKENKKLKKIIKVTREYIEWHYDLGTKENVEFCLLRDRVLDILKGSDKE